MVIYHREARTVSPGLEVSKNSAHALPVDADLALVQLGTKP